MADREDSQKSTSEPTAPAVKAEALPTVESPSISPAKDDEPAVAELTATKDEPVATSDSPIAPTTNVIPLRLALRRRRMALLAASVTVAAVLGAVVGAVTATSLSGSHDQVSSLQERKVMQQTVARLGDELSTLKTSLDAASKSAHAQTAQLAKLSQTMNEKLAAATTKANAALAQASAEVTGSISAPQTVAAPTPAIAEATPLPQPRPQQIAAVESRAERSEALLRTLGVTDEVWLEAVRCHHHRKPGPLAKKSLAQQMARLLQRADIFGARMAPRAARLPMPVTAAMQASYYDEEHQVDEAGAALVKTLGVYPPGAFVRLASQEVGVVVRRGTTATTPRVAVVTNRDGLPTGEPIPRDTGMPPWKITGVVAFKDVRVKLPLERLLSLA